MKNFSLLLVFIFATGCFSSAYQARVYQTRHSRGFVCLSTPEVVCLDRPRGVCSGWDDQWLARCPDDNSTWACRSVATGDGRPGNDYTDCRPYRNQPVVRASQEARPAVAQQREENSIARSALRAPGRPHITHNVDEFTGAETYLLISPIMLARTRLAQIQIVFLSSGFVGLRIQFVANRWQYLRCHSVAMMVDGLPFPVDQQPEHDGEAINGGVVEEVTLMLTPEEARQLANADAFRIRVCTDEITLHQLFFPALRQFATLTNLSDE